MSARVLAFPRKAPVPRLVSIQHGGVVFVIAAQGGGFLVVDETRSGGSAGMHGVFPTRTEADTEGRRVAQRIGATFLERGGERPA